MCNNSFYTTPDEPIEKKYRLADFFDMWWDDYTKSPGHFITPEQYKAVNAILTCRTPALGIDYYTCSDCGDTAEVYHSCKNRFCPTCSWHDTVKWAERTKDNMMSISHRHVVTTLPHQLNGLIKKNGKKLLDILMRVSAEMFKDWMGHKYNLKPGIISVLHTYGETKSYHVHTHMIVSWGGIHHKTKKLVGIDNEFVNYGFLQDKFRNKFEDRLVELFDNGMLEHNFSGDMDFKRFLKRINQNNWRINLEEPMDVPTQVVRYIGRYSKRACLSEYKITNIEGEYISFRYKDYKNKDTKNKPIEKIKRMHYRDFFPRLLQHVPLKYFRIVRYYGLYSNKGNIPKEYIYSENSNEEKQNKDWESIQIEKKGENPFVCKSCDKKMEYLLTIIERKNGTRVMFQNLYLVEKEDAIKRKQNAA